MQAEEQDLLFSWEKEERENQVPSPLGVIAFSPGQVKWNSLEQTFPGTDFKVCTKAALPRTKGLRELLVLCAGSTRNPACQAEVSCCPLRGSAKCVRKNGVTQTAGLMAGLGQVWFSVWSVQSNLAPCTG